MEKTWEPSALDVVMSKIRDLNFRNKAITAEANESKFFIGGAGFPLFLIISKIEAIKKYDEGSLVFTTVVAILALSFATVSGIISMVATYLLRERNMNLRTRKIRPTQRLTSKERQSAITLTTSTFLGMAVGNLCFLFIFIFYLTDMNWEKLFEIF